MAQTTPIPQSQDDADIVAPIVAEQTADDATRAAIVEQLAETESADKDDNTRQVLPFITRLYGGLVMLLGVCTIPLIIYELAYGIRQVLDGNVTIDALALPFILSCVEVVVLIANAACMAVFGVQLLRSHRRHAARWAYALMPLTLAHGMLSLALEGFGQNLLGPFVQMAILVALSVTLDPALLQERQLQWHLKRMDEHDAYNRAVQADMLGRDQSGKGYISLDFFNIFWLFVVGCVVGLAIETVYHFVLVHEYQDRAGLLWGPFSPIYGCGAVILTVCLNRLWRKNPVVIFLASAVIGGAFEFFVSWFMEAAFGITAWDYTGQWLSIGGRTSGKYMVFWGLLGLAWIKFVLPYLLRLINRIPWQVRYSLTAVCAALMLVDIVMTLMALDCWYSRVSGVPQSAPISQFFAEHFDDAYMQHRFQTMTIDPSKSGRIA
ncbi:putative ABC transporter permease [Bifidobacterium boum]|uniref:putative ABC transporter permease n=1 Tax=Bifidobacterium boum TaxID=78343 RepID=UPI003F92E7B9